MSSIVLFLFAAGFLIGGVIALAQRLGSGDEFRTKDKQMVGGSWKIGIYGGFFFLLLGLISLFLE